MYGQPEHTHICVEFNSMPDYKGSYILGAMEWECVYGQYICPSTQWFEVFVVNLIGFELPFEFCVHELATMCKRATRTRK